MTEVRNAGAKSDRDDGASDGGGQAEVRRSRGGRRPGRPAANWTGEDVFYVGWKETGEWRWIGTGATWDEAFASVKKVKTHYREKLVTYT